MKRDLVEVARDGWWAAYSGIQHDPSGSLRTVTLFDGAGAHPPSWGSEWAVTDRPLDDDAAAPRAARFGVTVRDPGDLPVVEPPS